MGAVSEPEVVEDNGLGLDTVIAVTKLMTPYRTDFVDGGYAGDIYNDLLKDGIASGRT